MLQYLINTTAIWLLSLIVFDIFLSKESYHNYNRFYLLCTFIMGALLPLCHWQEEGRIYATSLQAPVQQVVNAKQNVLAATTPVASNINWAWWLMIIYLSGAFVALCLLIVEIIKLASFYKKGKRSVENGWITIETGKDHAPFSFLNRLFVCSRQQYSNDEWNMTLTHEARHCDLYHFADLLLIQAARIVFWFHPLVYVYQKKLLLLHEFQADKVCGARPKDYGRFLVEQALLQGAPVLAHSFNRSPIKNRIVMLTHRSSAASKIKMLVFIPLALVCFVLFSKNVFSQNFEKNGNTVTYRGNKFELSEPGMNGGFVRRRGDTTTAKEKRQVFFRPIPVRMNGEKIYTTGDNITPKEPYSSKNTAFKDYILNGLSDDLSKLPDGAYTVHLENVVFGTTGKVVYYEFGGVQNRSKANPPVTIPGNLARTFERKMDQLMLDAAPLEPAKVDGKKVAVRSDILLIFNQIEVKDRMANIDTKGQTRY